MTPDPDAMLLRQLRKLEWKEPATFLREIARAEPLAAASWRMPARARALRTNRQKIHRERWHAAMFAHGLACRHQCETAVAVPAPQDSGYELMQHLGVDAFVAMREPPGRVHYGLVQLKEVVAEEWNQTASIQGIAEILNDRTRYPDPSRTHAVIYVSRDDSFDIADLRIDDRWSAVWLLGSADPRRRRLRLVGDVQKPAAMQQTEFAYPLPRVVTIPPRI